jgi:hypothetical protein
MSRHYKTDRSAPSDWSEQTLVLWEEDDATMRCDGHETPEMAFERIFGHAPVRELRRDYASYNEQVEALYPMGRVLGHSCDGGWVGVVVKVVSE